MNVRSAGNIFYQALGPAQELERDLDQAVRAALETYEAAKQTDSSGDQHKD